MEPSCINVDMCGHAYGLADWLRCMNDTTAACAISKHVSLDLIGSFERLKERYRSRKLHACFNFCCVKLLSRTLRNIDGNGCCMYFASSTEMWQSEEEQLSCVEECKTYAMMAAV